MNNIIKLYGNDYYNKLNVLRLLVFITDKCNYNCYYCYNSKPRQNIDIDCENLLRFIEHVHAKTTKLIRLELIGGEVTLCNNFDRLCQKLNELDYVIDIEIYTNLHKDIQYYNNLIYNSKIEVNATWHSIKSDLYNMKFIEKILSIDESIFKHYYVTIMFEPDFIKQSLNAYNIIRNKYPYAHNIEPSLCIHKSGGQPYKYNNNDLKLFYDLCDKSQSYRTEFYVEYDNHNISKLTFNDLQGAKINSFKFWKCNAGLDFLYIHNNGNVYKCTHDIFKKQHICNIHDSNYNLPDKQIICHYDYCPCNWETYREKIFNVKN